MTKIHWIPELQPHEWPDGVIEDMDPLLFAECVIPWRMASGVRFMPSPLPEGHVRNKGDSRHSIKGGTRLSDATDGFIPSTVAAVSKAYREALRIPAIGGFGLYFDTKPSVMVHIDRRPERLLWLRVGGDYIYEINDPAFYYRELSAQLEKLR